MQHQTARDFFWLYFSSFLLQKSTRITFIVAGATPPPPPSPQPLVPALLSGHVLKIDDA